MKPSGAMLGLGMRRIMLLISATVLPGLAPVHRPSPDVQRPPVRLRVVAPAESGTATRARAEVMLLAGPGVPAQVPGWLSPGWGPELRPSVSRDFVTPEQVRAVFAEMSDDGVPEAERLTPAQRERLAAIEGAFQTEARAQRRRAAAERQRLESVIASGDGLGAEAARARLRAMDNEKPDVRRLYRRWWQALSRTQAQFANELLTKSADRARAKRQVPGADLPDPPR